MSLIRSVIEYLPGERPEMSEEGRELLRREVAAGIDRISVLLSVLDGGLPPKSKSRFRMTGARKTGKKKEITSGK